MRDRREEEEVEGQRDEATVVELLISWSIDSD